MELNSVRVVAKPGPHDLGDNGARISLPSFRRSTTPRSTCGSVGIWAGGVEVRLGDEVNGFLAEEVVPSIAEVLPWLQEAIAHFYLESTGAQSLPEPVKERAKVRLFQPPVAGAQVRCPECGAPHAAPAGMTELIAFTCHHCGAGVKVDPLKVQ